MIKNAQLPPSVIKSLQNSEFEFYLTGSHYFGTVTKKSDIDFFVEDSQGILFFLDSLGFFIASNARYNDSSCRTVLRHEEGIDVQIVKNAEKKNQIQELFKTKQILSPTTEEWNLAFRLL